MVPITRPGVLCTRAFFEEMSRPSRAVDPAKGMVVAVVGRLAAGGLIAAR